MEKNSVSLINCNFLFIIFVKLKLCFATHEHLWPKQSYKLSTKTYIFTASKQLPVVSNSIFYLAKLAQIDDTQKDCRQNVNFFTGKKSNKAKSGSRSNRRLCDKCQNTMAIKIAKSGEISRNACHRCGIVT